MSDDHAPQPPRYFLDSSCHTNGDQVLIAGATANRLRRVMRIRRGNQLELVDTGSGHLLHAQVTEVSHDAVSCDVLARRSLQPLPPPRVVLAAALIRPQRFDLIVEKATELGVRELRPFQSQRGVIQSASQSRLDRWRRIATEAAEQSRRDDLPDICEVVEFAEIASAPRPDSSHTSSRELRLIASPSESSQHLSDAITTRELDAIRLLIGPEGGFSLGELSMARDHGWTPVTLGNRPLRAETAAIVAVAQTVEALR